MSQSSCGVSSCSCAGFKPRKVQLRSCDRCGHGWVEHALEQFQAHPPSGSGPVEVALPGLVFDLSSLVLFGAQAVPVQLKILLDRLYSILTPEQILNSLGWSLGDYVRGYMLQVNSTAPSVANQRTWGNFLENCDNTFNKLLKKYITYCN
uniref:Uncharacterized protein n=1 Tax=Fundulus heteroclitus TaxID=8078 RepID=A0A3Q2PIZ5_FUNHE